MSAPNPTVHDRLVSIHKALALVIASLSFDDEGVAVRKDVMAAAIDQVYGARNHTQSLLRSLTEDVLATPSAEDGKLIGLFKPSV